MITSRNNPTLRRLRRLRHERGDAALLEGPDLIAEAVAAGIDLEIVLATTDYLAGAEARRLQDALRRPPQEVATRLLDDTLSWSNRHASRSLRFANDYPRRTAGPSGRFGTDDLRALRND